MPATSQNTTGSRTFNATGSLIPFGARVKVDSAGQISVASASEAMVGVTHEAVAASGWGTVRMLSAPGTFLMLASGAITRGAQVYPAASGKIAGTGTTPLLMVALEAATADGDVIEVAVCQKGA